MISRRLLGTSFSFAALLALAVPAGAEEARVHPKAVVELFTSQGCSSCPPADALLTRISTGQDVIALAYHVNYWDYVGWPDTFGAEANSDRQRAYAKSWGSSRIYTPQMVVNGVKGVVGSRARDVNTALGSASLPLPVSVSAANNMVAIDIEGKTGLDNAVVWLVTYVGKADVVIERGENAGKTMRYTNVVNARQVLGLWEAQNGAHLKLPLGELLTGQTNGLAVLVQQEHDGLPGAIIGAAAIER
ncbi:DUF1223 domain-containing protein [Devosia sp.]|uniref:DUF1223 domain-containing protein n=1 Tax=Devosia sp. TaxID=1871048 RepID=UPI003266A3B6